MKNMSARFAHLSLGMPSSAVNVNICGVHGALKNGLEEKKVVLTAERIL